jgi:Tol biopolymer transport system component
MRISRFDSVFWSVAALLVAAIALVVWRGDQVGVRVLSMSPAEGTLAAASAPIVIEFAQRMDVPNVESHLEIEPKIAGEYVWRENSVYFLPSEAWQEGTTYEVRLLAGTETQLGHRSQVDLIWSFGVRPAGITYLREGEAGYELWVQTERGAEPRQLSHGGSIFDFAVSEDGEQVSYSVINDEGGIDLWMVSRAGGDEHMLLDCGLDRCYAADWSADGQIAYSRAPGPLAPGDVYGPPRVWILDPATGGTVRLHADTQKIGYGPLWSPNAQKLAYFDGVQSRIVVLELRNGNETYLPSQVGVVGSWAPDGGQMLYYDTRNEDGQTSSVIYRADFETQDVLPLFDPQPEDGEYSNPILSPDGNWIAMKVRPDGSGPGDQIWITPADGRYGIVVVDEPNYLYSSISWDPNSNALLFYRIELGVAGRAPEVWVWQDETATMDKLVDGASFPAWLP